MATANMVQCACDRCQCDVSLEEAIKKGDRYYCCEACANGHVNDESCKHQDCSCGD
ncbi:metallothionein [Myxosarcina sp. GI1]|uniref:metallothionein n=1 Tax=Myxosarcina sp. GI1 TaxID=1541065 RepID=UPI000568CE9C|nr:metallothionein [Myxosarcina sp. GI1]